MDQHQNKPPVASAAPFPADRETAGKWSVLGIVGIGIFMATLDSSIVNISLPKISSSFHVPLSGLVEWVIIAYLVVIGSLLLTFGRLSDMVGQKLLWLSGLLVFTLGSALCGAAPTLPLLVVFRALQGLGGAAIMSVSPAMTARAFPVGERGRAFGFIAVIVAAGTSAGPPLGGLITEAISWRWIFYINIPVGIIGIVATWRLLSEPMQLRTGTHRFDPLGAVQLSAGLTCLMMALSFGQDFGWGSFLNNALFAAAAILLFIFTRHERRVNHPIVDLTIFGNRLFSAAITSSFLAFLSLFAVMFLMPFYLEELLDLPPDRAGLIMTAVPLTISLVAPLSGWLSDRFGSQVLSSLGLAIASAGLWFLSNLTPQATTFDIVWPLAVAGFGQGLFQSPNNNAIMSSVPHHRLGIASGFLATVRVLGQASSVALAGAIFTSLGGAQAGAALIRKGGLPADSLKTVFIQAFHPALLTCAAIAALGVFTSLLRGPRREAG